MTREEALQLVKRIKGAIVYTEEEKEALETLIPELQSEDEKIRKLVVNRVRTATEMTESLRELLLTYLEKQKHSLNFDAISSWLRDHASRYVNSEYNEFHHCTEYDGTINVERLIADLKVAVDSGTFDIHEQKEQKPWEWGEEETKILDSIIDDYEKAAKSFCGYDGKIGLLRAIRDGEYDLPKRECGEEDEKIRNEILEYFTITRAQDFVANPERQKWISYIEKQKEPKSFIFPPGLGEVHFNPISCEQKERNPEWSEEDERMLSRCIKSVECSKQFADSETYKAAKDVEMNWLKSLPERFNLEPKQEWNEEDEKMLTSFLHKVEVCDLLTNKENVWIVKRLKSLRPQPKQEWGEEERQIIEKAACTIINFANTVETKEEEEELCELASKLQDLKPQSHWKPSEEQMYILNWVANILLNHDGIVEKEVAKKLQSLCNDLEKLM